MRIVTLLNEKGGVGKTTLATHIAAGLALRGQRVLLIDADPQGHATVSLGLQKEPGLLNLLVNEWEFSDVLRVPPASSYQIPGESLAGSLYVLPANVAVRAIPEAMEDVTLLSERLNELKDDVDVVVFDTSPTPSLFHSSIYLATDGILYPTECEYLSLDGLASSISRLERFNLMRAQVQRGPIEMLGIVPTKFERRTVLHTTNLTALLKRFGQAVWVPIEKRTAWREASAARRMVWVPDEAGRIDDKAVSEAYKLATRVEGRLKQWQSG